MANGLGRISVFRRGSSVTVRNNHFQVVYDLTTGLWNYGDTGGNDSVRGVGARWRQTDGKQRATSDPCRRAFRAEPIVADRFGEGVRVVFSHRAADDPITTELLLEAYSDAPFAVLALRIENASEVPVAVDRLELVNIPTTDGKPLGDVFLGSDPTEYATFLNGAGALARGFQPIRHGVAFPDDLSDEFISDGIILHPRTQRAVTFGFLDPGRWWNGAQVGHLGDASDERAPQGVCLWRVFQNCDGATCAPGSVLASGSLYLNVSTSAPEAQRHYAATVSGRTDPQPAEPPSVTAYIRVEDETTPVARHVSGLLASISKQGVAFTRDGGLHHLRLGSGWMSGSEKALTERFPSGIPAVVDEVHAHDLHIGADVHTFLVEGDVDPIYRAAVLTMRNGQPALFSCNGLTSAVAFDPTHPLTRDYLRARFETLYRRWGFDTIYASLLPFRDLASDDAARYRWHENDLTRAQILRRAGELLLSVREEIAPDRRFGLTHTSQGAPFNGNHLSAAGLDHYYRAHLYAQDGPWGLRALLRAYTSRWYTQGYWWNLDLGPLQFVQNRPRSESQLLMTLGFLSGGSLCFSDDLSTLDADSLALLAKCFPLLGVMARPVPVTESSNTFAWAQTIETSFGSWELLALLNLSDTFEDATIQFADLNLSRSKGYLAYEFWDRLFVGTYQRTFAVPSLPPRSARLFALREETDYPTLLGTDFHVSQGKVELMTLGWDDKSDTLLGICQGPKQGRGTLFFYVPESFVPMSAGCTGVKYSFQWKPPVYELHVAMGEEPAPFSIRFARASG